ncbi:hypothetical protein LCGC14_2929050, partial [marine sediment metagenome]
RKLSKRHMILKKLSKRSEKDVEKFIQEMRETVKNDPAVIEKFEEYGVSLDDIDIVHIEFCELDVSAKTKDKKIYINEKMLEDDGKVGDPTHYVAHEIIHYLQQKTGKNVDDSKREKEYLDKYGERMVACSRVNHKRDRDSVLAVKESLIDLLILSKTKHILGTYLSSFTEMAWWFGNCKAKVEIMGDHKEKEKKKVIKKLYGGGFVSVTKLWNGLIRKVKQD